MELTFTGFMKLMAENRLLAVTVILTLGVIFVNGWTDAPGAVATCVSTRCMTVGGAIALSAVCNFCGVLVMSLINTAVAQTISGIADFGNQTQDACMALAAALFSIVVWAVAAWVFGIPTSESHALVAGLTGSAIAIHNSMEGIQAEAWSKVLCGLFLSVLLGFGLGWLICRAVVFLFRNAERKRCDRIFQGAQILGAACMSFMHGAQDGQKFMGILLLGILLAGGQSGSGSFPVIPIWMMLVTAAVMGLGTAVGGRKIMKSMGMDMVRPEKYQGFSADIAASLCLLVSSAFGLPVSTTHVKTSAIMGVGASKRLSAVNFSVVKNMVYAWILTFPGCGLIGFLMAKLFLKLL